MNRQGTRDVKRTQDTLLEVNELRVQYQTDHTYLTALSDISFSLNNGENLGIIGESGSGKTTVALSLMGLIGFPHKVRGRIVVAGRELLSLAENEKNKLRWKTVAMVFQNSLDVLNPVMKVGQQIVEPLKETEGLSEREASCEAERLLRLVGLEDYWRDSYPHQLSGGMRQRALLAMALSCNPRLLILDEPISSVDAVTRKDLFEMIRNLQERIGFSMLVISHDFSAMQHLTGKIMVLYGGEILEKGRTQDVIEEPDHPYTRGLVNASVQAFPYKDLWGIPGEAQYTSKGCVFAGRCTQAIRECGEKKPLLKPVSDNREVACLRGGIVDLLNAEGVSKSFKVHHTVIQAVRDVSLQVRHGETVAIVGRSGSGKSTLAHILAGFLPPDKGQVFFDDRAVKDNGPACHEGGIQLVLQDPFSSLSHRFTVVDALLEPLRINNIGDSKERIERVKEVLQEVQLPVDDAFLQRYCSSLSGGQSQRIAIARALVMKPKLLLADEVTTMLDVSTQANLLRLLKGLQNSIGFAMVFVTHDLHLARKISERIIVLHHGHITDQGSPNYVTERSYCYHTKELMEAGLQ
jgi:peptide/nickel transport system ATP-binding protein